MRRAWSGMPRRRSKQACGFCGARGNRRTEARGSAASAERHSFALNSISPSNRHVPNGVTRSHGCSHTSERIKYLPHPRGARTTHRISGTDKEQGCVSRGDVGKRKQTARPARSTCAVARERLTAVIGNSSARPGTFRGFVGTPRTPIFCHFFFYIKRPMKSEVGSPNWGAAGRRSPRPPRPVQRPPRLKTGRAVDQGSWLASEPTA